MKEQEKTSEKERNEVDISNLFDKEFKIKFIKMLNKCGRRMDEHSENFKEELENIKNQAELRIQ